MKIAFQMEPLSDVVPEENNSALMMTEAARRGYEVYHYTPDMLSMSEEAVFAKAKRVKINSGSSQFFEAGPCEKVDLGSFDVIFFRQNPPFDIAYVTNTFLLDYLYQSGVLIVNNPFWIRNAPDKISIFEYKEHLPPSLITRDMSEITAFFEAHKDVVIKPLYEFHGHGIIRTSNPADASTALANHKEPLMFQKFIPEIEEGNKRVMFFDGEIVGAIKSVPEKGGDFRIFRDSHDIAYELNDEVRALCEKRGESFKERGLLFVGIDIIGPYLTEVNMGSVGSLLRFNAVYGGSYEGKLFDVIEKKRAP